MFKFAFWGIFLGALSPSFSQVASPIASPSQPAAAKITPLNQRRVDPAAMYHRVYAVVPIIGTGTQGDPLRPMFIQAPPDPKAAPAAVAHAGILAYQMQMSDDGKFALVEYVAATRADLLPVITSTAAGAAAVFERANATQAQIEAEFQKYKKDFTLGMFNTRAQ